MGQVPDAQNFSRPLIIGSGRLARHFAHYLELLKVPFSIWSRSRSTTPLIRALRDCNTVFLTISDDAIGPFVEAHPFLKEKLLVHMSGSQSFPGVYGAHPLMTFGPKLYDYETYKSIHFVTEKELPPLNQVLPFLPNPGHSIPRKQKALYHALCVSAGNFTSMLVTEVFRKFETDLGLSRRAMYPFIQQTIKNLESDAEASLTGPLIRGDNATVNANLEALGESSLGQLYQNFVEFFEQNRSHYRNERT